MRRGIEKLAWELASEDPASDLTLQDLSVRYGESIGRITDALDVLKIMRGMPTQIPAVDWEGRL